jgi:hypothetical protein
MFLNLYFAKHEQEIKVVLTTHIMQNGSAVKQSRNLIAMQRNGGEHQSNSTSRSSWAFWSATLIPERKQIS